MNQVIQECLHFLEERTVSIFGNFLKLLKSTEYYPRFQWCVCCKPKFTFGLPSLKTTTVLSHVKPSISLDPQNKNKTLSQGDAFSK